ncbi:recombinase family protein [Acetivibrio mesophilus]|uniref:recombinase family protein n=1 Tax=Acetivibrio mesophilus TaxID=2487273 RepID=UPI001F2F7995|nr:recombinase family protein [Acetivibrio mesophilus]
MLIRNDEVFIVYKAGIYVRESRDDNEENYETIETQRDLLIDYVKKNELGEIKGIYIDDNVSGSGFERKGIEELKRDVLEGRINLLVLKDLSRLGRNNAKTLLFLDFLEENGVRVVTFDGRYDSLKDNDIVGIETWFNERYILDISRKIRTNLRFKIQKGEYIGHAPFGYEKSPYEKNRLIVNKEQADIVRRIYSLYREGYGYSYIAGILNSEGIASPSKGLWNSIAIRRILLSRVYTGDTVQGVSEKISFKSKKTRRLPENRWVITENTHEPIVSKEEYEEIQRIRNNKNVRTGPHKGTIHVFRSSIFCGACGSIMFARKRDNRPMGYICSSYGKDGRAACTSHSIREKDLCEVVLEDITRLLKDEKAVKKIMQKLENNEMMEDYEALRKKLLKQLETKQKQQEILYQDKLENKISESLFLRMNQQIENRISAIKQEISQLEARKTESHDLCDRVFELKNYIANNGITNEIVKIMINRIIVFDKGDNYEEEKWKLNLSSMEKGYIELYGAVLIEYSF